MLIRSFQKILQDRLHEKSPLIQILLGPRQVGKTTVAKQILDQWKGHKVMITADGPTPPGAEWIRWNWEKALKLAPNCLFIVDEVQKVPGWSEIIKVLFDRERGQGNLKVLLLGSSSLYLQKGLHESLAGRFELIHAPHWSFAECREYFGWNIDEYLKYGAYPGCADFAQDEARWKTYILDSIIEPVLSRDILSQQSVANPALFRQTFELAMKYPAQIISFQKMLGQLQERGNASTMKHYLTLFEKCFLLLPLQKYSGSQIQTKASSPKILIHNPALIMAYQPRTRTADAPEWFGHVFESIMGAHLARIPHSELYYWRQGPFEVDYILRTPNATTAIEIKANYKKSEKGLKEFSKKYTRVRCESWNYDDCLRFLSQHHPSF